MPKSPYQMAGQRKKIGAQQCVYIFWASPYLREIALFLFLVIELCSPTQSLILITVELYNKYNEKETPASPIC
jgi:hypothetical protein